MLEAAQFLQEFSLADLRVGDRATVRFVRNCAPDLRAKLLSMGLVDGQEVEVLHFAPLGDPMTIRVLGFHLALRLNEAAQVVVTR